MATILDADKHSNEQTETSVEAKTFEVVLRFTDILAKNPLEAAKTALEWIETTASQMIYEVNEETGNKLKYTVDLSEDDENAVLPNN